MKGRNLNKLSRDKSKKRTRYVDISITSFDNMKTKSSLGLKNESKTRDKTGTTVRDNEELSDSTRLYPVTVKHSDTMEKKDVMSEFPQTVTGIGVLVPETLDVESNSCVIGPPSAASTPICGPGNKPQAPVTRLPASDSQYPVDLSYTQPHSPTIPSYSRSACQDESTRLPSDYSCSLLPQVDHLNGKNHLESEGTAVTNEFSRTDETNQSTKKEGDKLKQSKLKLQVKLLNVLESDKCTGKRKRQDSVEHDKPQVSCSVSYGRKGQEIKTF